MLDRPEAELTGALSSLVLTGLKPPVQKAHLHAQCRFRLQQVQQILQWLSGLRLLDGQRGTKDKDWRVLDYLDHLLILARPALSEMPSNEPYRTCYPQSGPQARGATSLQARESKETPGFSASLMPPACCLHELLKAGAAPPFPAGPDEKVSGRVCSYKASAQPGFYRLIFFFLFSMK